MVNAIPNELDNAGPTGLANEDVSVDISNPVGNGFAALVKSESEGSSARQNENLLAAGWDIFPTLFKEVRRFENDGRAKEDLKEEIGAAINELRNAPPGSYMVITSTSRQTVDGTPVYVGTSRSDPISVNQIGQKVLGKDDEWLTEQGNTHGRIYIHNMGEMTVLGQPNLLSIGQAQDLRDKL